MRFSLKGCPFSAWLMLPICTAEVMQGIGLMASQTCQSVMNQGPFPRAELLGLKQGLTVKMLRPYQQVFERFKAFEIDWMLGGVYGSDRPGCIDFQGRLGSLFFSSNGRYLSAWQLTVPSLDLWKDLKLTVQPSGSITALTTDRRHGLGLYCAANFFLPNEVTGCLLSGGARYFFKGNIEVGGGLQRPIQEKGHRRLVSNSYATFVLPWLNGAWLTMRWHHFLSALSKPCDKSTGDWFQLVGEKQVSQYPFVVEVGVEKTFRRADFLRGADLEIPPKFSVSVKWRGGPRAQKRKLTLWEKHLAIPVNFVSQVACWHLGPPSIDIVSHIDAPTESNPPYWIKGAPICAELLLSCLDPQCEEIMSQVLWFAQYENAEFRPPLDSLDFLGSNRWVSFSRRELSAFALRAEYLGRTIASRWFEEIDASSMITFVGDVRNFDELPRHWIAETPKLVSALGFSENNALRAFCQFKGDSIPKIVSRVSDGSNQLQYQEFDGLSPLSYPKPFNLNDISESENFYIALRSGLARIDKIAVKTFRNKRFALCSSPDEFRKITSRLPSKRNKWVRVEALDGQGERIPSSLLTYLEGKASLAFFDAETGTCCPSLKWPADINFTLGLKLGGQCLSSFKLFVPAYGPPLVLPIPARGFGSAEGAFAHTPESVLAKENNESKWHDCYSEFSDLG